MMSDPTKERIFQDEMISQLCENGWISGKPDGYDRQRALYLQDVLTFVQTTQPKAWEKLARVYPQDTERHFLDALLKQLNKADINATDKLSRTYGTLGFLRHGLKIRNADFSLC